jgi:hypothetical protein
MGARSLVIGNSHVASLFRVWRDSGERIDLDFLAAKGTSLSGLVVIDRHKPILSVAGTPGVQRQMKWIVPEAAEEKGFLELEAYAVIVVYGLQLVTGGAWGHRPDKWKWFELLEASNSGLSRRVWQMAARDFVRNTFHYQLVSQFPMVIRERVVCLPCPFPNNRLPRARAVAKCGRERVDEALDIMAAELRALGVRFSGLPSALTDASGYLTASEYMKDPVHLNAQGARIVLSFIEELLAPTAGVTH